VADQVGRMTGEALSLEHLGEIIEAPAAGIGAVQHDDVVAHGSIGTLRFEIEPPYRRCRKAKSRSKEASSVHRVAHASLPFWHAVRPKPIAG
jgi:hypothetical protein